MSTEEELRSDYANTVHDLISSEATHKVTEDFSHIRFKESPDIPERLVEPVDPDVEKVEQEMLARIFQNHKQRTVRNYAKDRSLRGKARKRARRRKYGSV